MYNIEKTPDNLLHGTTALGLSWKEGVVLAADRRISAGTYMAGTRQKIFLITPKIGIATAGVVTDAQSLVELMRAELKIFALENGFEPTVKTAAHLLAVILRGGYKRYMPYITQLIIAGIDKTGSHVFSLDLAGGTHEEKVVVIGSGMMLALGFIEARYEETKDSKDKVVEMAETALRSAISRDLPTGNGIDMIIISADGSEERTIDL
jgi:proteasome beta subunit